MISESLDFLFWVGAVSIAAGLWAFLRGYRPKRTGDTLHCRKCNYILHGQSEGTCPECGTGFTLQTVHRGERVRKAAPIIVGLLLLLLGVSLTAIGVANRVGAIDWYHYRPTNWVLKDLDSTTSPYPPSQAWNELTRRRTDGELSAEQLDRLTNLELKLITQGTLPTATHAVIVEDLVTQNSAGKLSDVHIQKLVQLALQEQSTPGTGNLFAGVLELAFEKDRFTPEQKKQFFDNMLGANLVVRQRVNPGAKVPYQIHVFGKGPASWRLYQHLDQLWVDGVLTQDGGGGIGGGTNTNGSFGSITQSVPPGHHVMKVVVSQNVYTHGKVGEPGNNPIETRKTERTAEFDVLEKPQAVELLTQPDAATIRKCFVAEPFEYTKVDMYGTIMARALPAPVAFSVWAVMGGREIRMGSFSVQPAGLGGYGCGVSIDLEKEKIKDRPAEIDIILRSDPNAAEDTTDITSIWSGEIRLEKVKVAPFVQRSEGTPPPPSN